MRFTTKDNKSIIIYLLLLIASPVMGSFYHSDHLGSANWITDKNGAPVQPNADFISKPAFFIDTIFQNRQKSVETFAYMQVFAKNNHSLTIMVSKALANIALPANCVETILVRF